MTGCRPAEIGLQVRAAQDPTGNVRIWSAGGPRLQPNGRHPGQNSPRCWQSCSSTPTTWPRPTPSSMTCGTRGSSDTTIVTDEPTPTTRGCRSAARIPPSRRVRSPRRRSTPRSRGTPPAERARAVAFAARSGGLDRGAGRQTVARRPATKRNQDGPGLRLAAARCPRSRSRTTQLHGVGLSPGCRRRRVRCRALRARSTTGSRGARRR